MNLTLIPQNQIHMEWAIFLTMLIVAMALSKSPLGWPLKWAETFYHELSHGLACILTGGRVRRIELNLNGSGVCTTQGGWRLPILLAGYTGAALWGGVLYCAGWYLGVTNGAHGATLWMKAELAVLVIVAVLWVRDVTTLAILTTIGSIYAASIYAPASPWLPLLLQFIGLYVLLNAIRAPLFLIDGEHVGDGADLANLTLIIPEAAWIALWYAIALATLATCMIITLPGLAPWLTRTLL
ncbi:MAG: M50 family peptidase [Proteobacteria bacterium]|nr:M50 family peptidase [Pseudomonadota bacterium]